MKTAIALVAALCVAHAPVSSAMQVKDRDELATGIRQVEGGEFDAAVITLDAAARKLAAEGNRPKELARAYAYLAIAYLELGQEPAARAKVLEAVRTDKDLRLDAREFPPKFVRFFEQVRGENAPAATSPVAAATPAPAPRPSPSAPPAAPTTTAPAKGGSSKTLPILLAVGGVAAIGAGVAVAGGGSDTPTPTTVPAVTTLSSLSATVTSPQRSTNITCTQNVAITVSLTNRSSAAVAVTSVRRDGRAVSGGCNASSITLNPTTSTVGANQTVTVYNGNLYSSTGSGCCNAGSACDGRAFCEFNSTFVVVTAVGEVPAGGFNHGITFDRCIVCSTSLAAASDCSEAIRQH